MTEADPMHSAGRVYEGVVVHKRLRPKPHALAYNVFSLLLDADRIPEACRDLRLLSHNRPNLLAFYDRDHGASDGTPAGVYARRVLAEAGIGLDAEARILLLAYPRVLGYVFNPLSVFYALDSQGHLQAIIYEVNNTFGERTSYIVRAGTPQGAVFHQSSDKKMFVSPFAEGSGRYSFHVTQPGAGLLVGVAFRDEEGPLIKTHFKARGLPLTDRTLARLMLRIPFLTFKVMGAIHLEALKLWLKGVPLTVRHRLAASPVSTAGTEPSP